MSKFDEIKEQEQEIARRRARPTALQLAWLGVVIVFGGVIAWLALTGPEAPPPTVTMKTAEPDNGTELALAIPAPKDDQTAAETADQEPQSAPADTEQPETAPAETSPPQPQKKAGLSLRTDPALVEQTEDGPLPKISDDGREPWKVYARPFDEVSAKPRISIVIAGLGLSSVITRTAIETLPGEVTFAFSVYGDNLANWIDEARGEGHEVMLLVPMEPYEYPKNDPGPDTLRVSLSAEDNLKRLYHVLTRATRYVGVMNDMGSKFTATESAITPILEDIKKRGLLFMDARSSQYSAAARIAREIRVPRAVNNRYLDNKPNESDIMSELQNLENVAKTYGAAAGIGHAYPVTVRTVAKWAAGLADRGFVLAPITAVANRQPVR